MKPLRNILLLFAYIVAIVSIALTFVLRSQFIWIPLFALLLVGIAYLLVRTERRHSRGPAATGIIALILTFCVPYFFPPKISDDVEELQAEIEESQGESLEEMEKLDKNGVIDLVENDDEPSPAEANNPANKATEIIDAETATTITEENIEEVPVEERGLAIPEIE